MALISVLLALPIIMNSNKGGAECAALNADILKSKPDILNLSANNCWRIEASKRSQPTVMAGSNGPEVRIDWRPCDYLGKGFRSEIVQNVALDKKAQYSPWGIVDEERFPRVSYEWAFSLNDPGHLIGDWSRGAFIAQWHSSTIGPKNHALDGGSPVIGLFYSKPPGSRDSYGTLQLLMKVSRAGAYCAASDALVNNRFCRIVLAQASMSEDERHTVHVDIAWDREGAVGSVGMLFDGKPMQGVAPAEHRAGDRYFYPNKQSSAPDRMQLGLYVQSQHKEEIQKNFGINSKSDRFLQGKSNTTTPFCSDDRKLSMTVSDFSFTAKEASAHGATP